MPVDREIAVDLARNLVDLYDGMAHRLAGAIAAEVRDNPDPDDAAKLGALRRLADAARRMLAELTGEASAEALARVTEAYVRGGNAALAEVAGSGIQRVPDWWERRDATTRVLGRLLGYAQRRDDDRESALRQALARLRFELPGIDAIQALVNELTQRLQSTHFRILRWAQDAYREVIAAPAADVLAGTKTRVRASQVAWEKLLSQGITGFTDRGGRRWRLRSYVEMAARSTVAQAAVEGHLARLDEAGIDLVIVSNAPQECKLCRPFEGKVLSPHGPTGTIREEHAITGAAVTVRVVATVAQAVARGLMHPNCRHSLSAFLPGVTKPPTNTADPKGDADRQRLRALEREVRKWREIEALALDDEGRRQAAARAREWQARIREHVADTGLLRQRHRERITDLDLGRGTGRQRPPDPAPEPDPAPAERDQDEGQDDALDPSATGLPSDDDLANLDDDALFALFAQHADNPDALERITAELDRRDDDTPAEPEPDPLEGVNLEGIGVAWLNKYAADYADRADVLERIDAERARRAAPAPPPPTVAPAESDVDLTAEERRLADLVADGWDWQDAYAEVYGLDADDLDAQARAAEVDAHRIAGETREDTLRRLYREYVAEQYIAAETDTRGHLLSKAGTSAGIDPETLFSGPVARARKYGSEDLLRWFADHGRLTYTEYKAQLLGRESDRKAADKTRRQSNGQDFI